MQNERIHLERIKKQIQRIKSSVHGEKHLVSARYIYNSDAPIPHADTETAAWQDISIGQVWGNAWGSAWFLLSGKVPAKLKGKQVGLWFDCDGEACVFKNGSPWQGLTPKVDWYHNAAKYFVPIFKNAKSGDGFRLLIEAAANDLFGSGKTDYQLRECALVSFDEEIYQLWMDLEILQDLAISLPSGNVRRAKLIYGLNQICNMYNQANGMQQAKQICAELLSKPANASALTAYSVGHAHLDLAWLWPMRESKRKGGRTFANALRLLEQYPDYVFGASQAQLYKWIKELYPALYKEVQAAVKAGRWEVQGAHWVEFDTNLISGESIIRQFMYGQAFFAREFGIVPNCLWLPDCFGFSANMPQFMKGCKVDYFITQKLSWNESNTFPHHLFIWQGIDGSEVKAHQLPTNDYNFSNNPSSFIQTEQRFAQAELAEGFLNLYGIGDGGGGPTRNHLEYGLRQRDLEGLSKFHFGPATDFLAYYASLDPQILPKAYGELYLEFHRGTYTSQARMKQMNAGSQQLLKTAEALCVFNGDAYPELLRKCWEDTLLLQFHDILPGSSIAAVYRDAEAIYAGNKAILEAFIGQKMQSLSSGEASLNPQYLLCNPCGAENSKWLCLPASLAKQSPCLDSLPLAKLYLDAQGLHLYITLRPWSLAVLSFSGTPANCLSKKELQTAYQLQNEYLQVTISSRGSLCSIIDMESGAELLAGESNLLQLWEDEPNNWSAWDINHFYRETSPLESQQVSLLDSGCYANAGSYISQEIIIGQSRVRQTISLASGERQLIVRHETEWNESHKMLRVRFQPDILCSHASCGIQMGSIKRSTRPQNAWEAARFEFPAQGYVDLSDGKQGFSIICGDKFGYSLHQNVVEMALLRSPDDPDPQADIGKHSYSYAIYCHNGKCDLPQQAESFSTPILAELVQGSPKQAVGSLFSLEHGKLLLSTVKPSEDGKDIILRLFEPNGLACEDILRSSQNFAKVFKCNMLEEALEELVIGNPITAKAFEIITLRLQK